MNVKDNKKKLQNSKFHIDDFVKVINMVADAYVKSSIALQVELAKSRDLNAGA